MRLTVSSEPPNAKEAERSAREAVRLLPGWFWAHYQLGWALRLQTRYPEAIEALEYTLQLSPGFDDGHIMLGWAYVGQGQFSRAIAELDTARSKRASGTWLALSAAAHAGLGNHGRAIAELEKALKAGYRRFATLESSPEFAPLRGHPRFVSLLAKCRP